MMSDFKWVPETLRQRTPSGGGHLFFRWLEDHTISNKVSLAQYPGIDVRGSGGYVLIPPSTNGKGHYRWLNEDAEIVDAPEWLLKLVEVREEPKFIGR